MPGTESRPASALTPRPFLDSLETYIPGEQPRGGGYIKLNTNEFPYAAAPQVTEAIVREAGDSVRVYPDPTATALREALAARHRVTADQVLAGNGSDEILRLLVHAWLERGRRMAVVEPTYTLYQVLAAQFESAVDVYPLEHAEGLPGTLFRGEWDACFLPVPNPPLGTIWPAEQLLRLAATGRLLVLDGAYVDFIDAPEAAREPLPIAATLAEHPNVVFTRTFSKSFGLAGLRVGYAIGTPEMIGNLHRLRDSYNLNRISQAAALGALAGAEHYRRCCDEIIASRRMLAAELTGRGFRVHPSQGNFVFARHPQAERLYEQLKAEKILVRYFRHSGLADGLRITIGTPEQNAGLLAGLDRVLGRGV